MISQPTKEQVTALTAVFQACQLVYQLAHDGTTSSEALEVCMNSLLNQNPDSLEQLYHLEGSDMSLQLGVDTVKTLLADRQKGPVPDVLRYVLSVLHLERKLSQNKSLIQQVASGIENAQRQAEHFSSTHHNVYANLASLYQETLSTFSFRIQVHGNAAYLQQKSVAEKIRCLLFSAIRSAFLWRQLGGKRHHLVFYRKKIVRLLAEA